MVLLLLSLRLQYTHRLRTLVRAFDEGIAKGGDFICGNDSNKNIDNGQRRYKVKFSKGYRPTGHQESGTFAYVELTFTRRQ